MAFFFLCSVIHVFPVPAIIPAVLRSSTSPVLAHVGSSRAHFTPVPLSALRTGCWGRLPQAKFTKTPKKNKNHRFVLHWNSGSCCFPDPGACGQTASKIPWDCFSCAGGAAPASRSAPRSLRARVWVPCQTPVVEGQPLCSSVA